MLLLSVIFASAHLFIYVNKADNNSPTAQHMQIFKQGQLQYDWPISTGLEELTRDIHNRIQLSVTPTGYFTINKSRMFIHYKSTQWNVQMPYAMFLSSQDYPNSGIAIHGTSDTDHLGHANSHGCINLSIQQAKQLYYMVKSEQYPVSVYIDDR